jgi:thiol-disulfide isomerase/thioredoxin
MFFRRPGLIGLCSVLVAFMCAVGADTPPPAAKAQTSGSSQTSRGAMSVLEKSWPDHPEWVAMFVDILQGSQLGPNDGWFKKAVAQKSRYGWEASRSRLDRDGDGRISRSEVPSSDADFARLDRDRDGSLTATDFDFSPNALAASPGMMLFYRADRDGNGKVTREEMQAIFDAMDSGHEGFLSLSDFQDALTMPMRRPSSSGSKDDPSKMTLVKGLFRQEIGSLQPGPAEGEIAPDFALETIDGRETVTLTKLVGSKPVVLVFGNFTCGPFRIQAGNVEKLYRRYKDRASFVMVYVREAHPTDGWHMESNNRVGVSLPQPKTYGERVGVATRCQKTLGLGFPMLVDSINDTVGARYSGMPSRLYLIDSQGKVAYKSGRGPFGFKPAELEQALILNLQEESAKSTTVGQTSEP